MGEVWPDADIQWLKSTGRRRRDPEFFYCLDIHAQTRSRWQRNLPRIVQDDHFAIKMSQQSHHRQIIVTSEMNTRNFRFFTY